MSTSACSIYASLNILSLWKIVKKSIQKENFFEKCLTYQQFSLIFNASLKMSTLQSFIENILDRAGRMYLLNYVIESFQFAHVDILGRLIHASKIDLMSQTRDIFE